MKPPSRFKLLLGTMPPLQHAWPEQPYDVAKSEVVQWLIQQPVALEKLFQIARESGWLEFDKDTRKWRGKSPEMLDVE